VERLGHRPALDGVRGVAILAVVAFHFFKLRGGFLGVDLFFVLSGFLITTLLLEERSQAGRISLRRFYIRRGRRLLPAVGALLVFLLVLGPTRYSPTKTLEMLAISAGYAVNLVTAFHHAALTNATPIVHLWSLSEEEQFYLIWPLALLVLLRYCSERRLAVILAVVFVGLIWYRGHLVDHGAPWVRVYFSPDTHADGLVMGCFAALARRQRLRIRSGYVAFAVFLLFGMFTAVANNNFLLMYGLPIFELAAAVVVVGAATAEGQIVRGLSWKPLAWLGTVSYSLYLWHQPAQWLTGWNHPWYALTLAVPLTLGSYYLVERPFRLRRVAAGQPTVVALAN
jgi:peptidoglycan/LPS O-acetylase OafA/YrhL